MESADLTILLWGRVIERIVIVFFGGLSMIAGWHLFLRGVITQQTIDVSSKDWKVAFRKVGPGLFFALFGCCVIGYGIHRPLTIDPGFLVRYKASDIATPQKPEPSPKNLGVVYFAFGTSEREDRRLIRALNTFLELDKNSLKQGAVTAEDLAKAQSKIVEVRYQLLRSRFSDTDLQLWLRHGARFDGDKTGLTAAEIETLTSVQPWFRETSAMEKAQ